MSSERRRIGLLTGTFDPVHLGHVAMARAAQAACELEEVWFLVNPAPGHKQGVSGLSDRLSMVRLAVSGEAGLREGEPGVAGGAPDGSPVRHTMADFEALMGRYPACDFVFIVGADVLAGMASWPEQPAEVVARAASFAAVRRPGQAALTWPAGLRVQWFDLDEYAGASSGRVRAAVAAGEAPADLDPRVLQYIRARGLYR